MSRRLKVFVGAALIGAAAVPLLTSPALASGGCAFEPLVVCKTVYAGEVCDINGENCTPVTYDLWGREAEQ